MKIFDGKETANKFTVSKNRIEYLNIVQNIIPCLAVIIVGDNPELFICKNESQKM